MQESDFVILAARNEEDISNLEVSLPFPSLPAWWSDGLPRGQGHPVAPDLRLTAPLCRPAFLVLPKALAVR